MSVFGRQHNDHRWVEIWDERTDSWVPADPSMGVIGNEAWLKARVWFGERMTIDTSITNDMLGPISIFVVDGHGSGGNNRVVKFDADGNYLMQWGSTGREYGEFRDPHALAMDSMGRLFVGDRGNNRIQIFTQDGEHLETWSQFGRPSGLFIDDNDMLYAADSESNLTWGMNRGYLRGIYIGSAIDGFVIYHIPDPNQAPDTAGTTAAEGIAADKDGNLYGAEVGPEQIVKYTLRGIREE